MNFLQVNLSNPVLAKDSALNNAAMPDEIGGFHHYLRPLMNAVNTSDVTVKDETNTYNEMEMLNAITDIVYEQLALLNNVTENVKDGEHYEAVHYLLRIIENINQFVSEQEISTFENRNSSLRDQQINFVKLIETLNQIMLMIKDKWNSKELVVKEETPMEKIIKIIESKLDSVSNLQKNVGDSKLFEMSLKHTEIVEANTQKFNTQNVIPVNIKPEQLHLPKPVVVQLSLNTASEQTAKTQLLEKMEQLLGRSRVQVVNGKQNLMIRLTPEHLGTIHIKLQHLDSGLNARIIAHSAATAKLLEGSLLSLKVNLQASNVQVDKIEVVFQDSTKTLQQEKEQNNNGQQSNKQHQQQEDNQQQSFRELLDVELETSEVG